MMIQPKNHPIEKEHHLPNLLFWVYMVYQPLGSGLSFIQLAKKDGSARMEDLNCVCNSGHWMNAR